MKLFRRKKEEKKKVIGQYNITAIKKTGHYDLRFTLKGSDDWTASLASKKDVELFFKQLKHGKSIILSFDFKGEDTACYLNRNKIIYGSCEPETIKVSEWFVAIDEALGFMETLKLDRWREIKENWS
jgi:hypothetical protein